MRGRKRTPSNVHRLRGTPARDREGEPQVARGLPKRPAWLSKKARPKWEELLPILDGMHVLSSTDGPALGFLCEVWVQWDEDRTAALASRLQSMMAEFGLTPAARARLKVLGSSERGGYEGFRRGR